MKSRWVELFQACYHTCYVAPVSCLPKTFEGGLGEQVMYGPLLVRALFLKIAPRWRLRAVNMLSQERTFLRHTGGGKHAHSRFALQICSGLYCIDGLDPSSRPAGSDSLRAAEY
jgi:hypothetical protein